MVTDCDISLAEFNFTIAHTKLLGLEPIQMWSFTLWVQFSSFLFLSLLWLWLLLYFQFKHKQFENLDLEVVQLLYVHYISIVFSVGRLEREAFFLMYWRDVDTATAVWIVVKF
jgi:hypothetical protein